MIQVLHSTVVRLLKPSQAIRGHRFPEYFICNSITDIGKQSRRGIMPSDRGFLPIFVLSQLLWLAAVNSAPLELQGSLSSDFFNMVRTSSAVLFTDNALSALTWELQIWCGSGSLHLHSMSRTSTSHLSTLSLNR